MRGRVQNSIAVSVPTASSGLAVATIFKGPLADDVPLLELTAHVAGLVLAATASIRPGEHMAEQGQVDRSKSGGRAEADVAAESRCRCGHLASFPIQHRHASLSHRVFCHVA